MCKIPTVQTRNAGINNNRYCNTVYGSVIVNCIFIYYSHAFICFVLVFTRNVIEFIILFLFNWHQIIDFRKVIFVSPMTQNTN